MTAHDAHCEQAWYAEATCYCAARADVARADARTRLELQHRAAEATETRLRDVVAWFETHDLDALAQAFDETEQS